VIREKTSIRSFIAGLKQEISNLSTILNKETLVGGCLFFITFAQDNQLSRI